MSSTVTMGSICAYCVPQSLEKVLMSETYMFTKEGWVIFKVSAFIHDRVSILIITKHSLQDFL